MSIRKMELDSGIIEMYLLGGLDENLSAQVEQLCLSNSEWKSYKERLESILHSYANSISVKPAIDVTAGIKATVNFKERMKSGEVLLPVPTLSKECRIKDFASWTERSDLQLPEDPDEIHSYILGISGKRTSLLIWIKNSTPPEVHSDELESFFILEGTCNILVEDQVYSFQAGDYFAIPLHTLHTVKVTSDIPCKAILERIKISA